MRVALVAKQTSQLQEVFTRVRQASPSLRQPSREKSTSGSKPSRTLRDVVCTLILPVVSPTTTLASNITPRLCTPTLSNI